ncbi:MAG: hypothetical protein GEU68_10120 [Actinobacteria bacterium]|nr:hypothetical protein [Actinomycetota bacterium]
MRLRLVLVLTGVIAVLAGISAFALWRVASDLRAAQVALEASSDDASVARIQEAQRHVDSALAEFDGGIVTLARWIPVTRQNLDAMGAVAQGLLPVLDTSRAALEGATAFERRGLVEEGRIGFKQLGRLEGPFRRQARGLDELLVTVDAQGSALLLPAVWNALEKLGDRAPGTGRGAR